MSQLIQMRQRIKTIETIKKVTHAMRLIAMSSHAHLKASQSTLKEYTKAIDKLFLKTLSKNPGWSCPIMYPTNTNTQLFIIIGSQKGLCGNFNSALFSEYRSHIQNNSTATFITVGKKARDFIENKMGFTPIISFEEFTSRNYLSIAHTITLHIVLHTIPYTSVTVLSNLVKNFFAQIPHDTLLIPLQVPAQDTQENSVEYTWEQPINTILSTLSQQYLEAHLQNLLFESLLAEQAARFISMDNSTRNANNLLETTKLQYNKLRQAKITKELIELAGSLT